MRKLHWLPVGRRIEFKILMLSFKCIHGMAPPYQLELIHERPDKGTRSDEKNYLNIPTINKKSFGERTFSFSSAKLWNDIPEELCFEDNVKLLKKDLKHSF